MPRRLPAAIAAVVVACAFFGTSATASPQTAADCDALIVPLISFGSSRTGLVPPTPLPLYRCAMADPFEALFGIYRNDSAGAITGEKPAVQALRDLYR